MSSVAVVEGVRYSNMRIWYAAFGFALIACGTSEESPNSSAEDDNSPNTSSATGGNASNSSGGGTSMLDDPVEEPEGPREPDPDEPCTEDPRVDDWFVHEFEATPLGSSLAQGGDLLAVTLRFDEEDEVHMGRVSTGGIEWLSVEAFPSSESPSVSIAPDGSFAVASIRNVDDIELRSYEPSTAEWSASVAIPGGLPVLLSGKRAVTLITEYAGTTAWQFTPAGGWVESDTTSENYLTHSFLAGQDVVSSLGAPSLVANPHGRIEYTWDVGFGTVENIPDVLERDYVWSEFFREFPSGIAVRGVRLWAVEDTQGTYLHTRTGGTWDAGLKVSDASGSSQEDALPVSYAGQDLLFIDDSAEHLSLRTHTAGSWSDLEALPRSRTTVLKGHAGGTDGSSLLVGEQQVTGFRSHKLYRRGTDGTWYCPRLEPSFTGLSVAGDTTGGYAVLQQSYALPPRLIVLPSP